MHRPGIKKRFPPFYADELSLCLVYTNIHLLITRKENQQEREPAFKGLSLSIVLFRSLPPFPTADFYTQMIDH